MLTQKEVANLKKNRRELSEYIYRTELMLSRWSNEDIEDNMRLFPDDWLGWYIENPSARQVDLYSDKTGAEVRELLVEHLKRKRQELNCVIARTNSIGTKPWPQHKRRTYNREAI